MSASAQASKFRPRAFGNYTLLTPIASGGMGELFLARRRADSGFERLVVIKRILPHLNDKPEFIHMFLDEARVAAQIHHPNVCQILELGQVEDRYYMALEYLEGVSLTQLIVRGREHTPLRELRLLVSIMTQVCEGLHFAHNVRKPDGSLAGVVHRDVNPKNIFVTSAGVAKVIDFGIVKAMGALNVTRTGSVKGTYSYMSPEQIQATSVDRRSDIFSLGIVSWEAFTGCRLFKRDNDFHTWRAITEEPIPPPSQYREDIPPELDEVVLRALSRDRETRFRTARELAVALEGSLGLSPMTPVAVSSRVEAAFAKELGEQRERTKLSADDLDGAAPVPAPWDDVGPFELGETDTNVTPSAERLPTAPEPTPSAAALPTAPLEPVAPAPAPAPAPAAAAEPEPAPRHRILPMLFGFLLVAAVAAGAMVYRDRQRQRQGEDDGEPSARREAVATPDAGAGATTPPPVTPDAAAEHANGDEVTIDAAVAAAAEVDAAVAEPRDAAAQTAAEPADARRRERDRDRERERDKKRRDKTAERPRGNGTLTVNARPYGTVFIDGHKVGVTPIVKRTLAAGRHTVRVQSSVDGSTKSFRVNIEPDKAVRRNVKW